MGNKNHSNIINIYLLRHGQTDLNKKGILQGQSNNPLNALGREQAKVLPEQLQSLAIKEIITSPLARAYETGIILKTGLEKLTNEPLTFSSHDGLKEIDLGKYEGHSKNRVDEIHGEGTFKRWTSLDEKDDTIDFCDKETKLALRQRAFKTLNEIANKTENKSIAIVGHGTFFGNFLTTLGIRDIYPANGEIIHLQYNRETKQWKYMGLIENHINKKLNIHDTMRTFSSIER